MKKVALVFVLAVLAPSLVLAWLAVRSLQDQQFVLERQQSLLDQRVTDTLAQNVTEYLAERQQEFGAQVEKLAAGGNATKLAVEFDDQLRKEWPLAEVGFCVTAAGKILSPVPNARQAAQMFRLDNSGFLGNREPVEVYWNNNIANGVANSSGSTLNSLWNWGRNGAGQSQAAFNNGYSEVAVAASKQSAQKKEPAVLADSLNTTNGLVSGNLAANSQANAAQNSSFAKAKQMAFTLGNSTAPSVSQRATDEIQPIAAAAVPPGSSAQKTEPEGAYGSANTANGLIDGNASAKSQAFTLEDSKASPATQPATEESQPVAAVSASGNLEPGPLAVNPTEEKDARQELPSQSQINYKAAQTRKVSPQSQMYQTVDKTELASANDDVQNNLSKAVPAEAEFRQLIGDQADGMLARFLQNKLKLMFWHRLRTNPDLIFGAQLDLGRVVDDLRPFVQPNGSRGNDDLCLALLDDNAKPVIVSNNRFQANWKQPFVATEIGDALPHWEAAGYLANPARLKQAAHTARLTLGLLVAVLVVAIGIGSLLIVRSLNVELTLARQKTDFVGNVSHELKTPLTSIRMFSELLAEGRVTDPARQHSYLQIITAEAARLTRLINNVLDFSRMERGEKKYTFQPCDLGVIAGGVAETFRPHLESAGFRFECNLPEAPVPVRGDADALSQVIVNLLSNAEKYSNGGKEISLELAQKQTPLPHVEIRVLDRGPGVPRGCEEKVFEKFYRAHDSLSSGIQGSGLGLTIARQIARAHGGNVAYEPREGGGSCFSLRLPIQAS